MADSNGVTIQARCQPLEAHTLANVLKKVTGSQKKTTNHTLLEVPKSKHVTNKSDDDDSDDDSDGDIYTDSASTTD